jgi:hypothetical protein
MIFSRLRVGLCQIRDLLQFTRIGLCKQSSGGNPILRRRHQLQSAGWQPGQSLTLFTDGEPGLANHVKSATGHSVPHILDWWHISMRVKHVENAAAGLKELCSGRKGADKLPWLAERLRWLVWHGKIAKGLEGIRHLRWRAESLQDLSRPSVGSAIRRLQKRCEFLSTYLERDLSETHVSLAGGHPR